MKTFEKIYRIASLIPKGKVATYQQIATLVGIKNPRVVGFALRTNSNPREIPCHRIVGSNGKLTGYSFGGVVKKRKLLEREGVHFLDEETVDLGKSFHEW